MSYRTVVYDGECGFCGRTARIGMALDWFHRLDWRPRSDPSLIREFPQLTSEETANRMISIGPDGKVRGGFFAVRDVISFFPLTFLFACLLYVPGMPLIGVPAYQWAARNRHRFGGTSNCEIKKTRR